jgi:hypothetical protein
VVKILKHAFLRRGIKICVPCPQLCGHVKEPSNFVNYGLWPYFRPSLAEVSHAAWCAAPLEMNNGNPLGGLEYNKPSWLQC